MRVGITGLLFVLCFCATARADAGRNATDQANAAAASETTTAVFIRNRAGPKSKIQVTVDGKLIAALPYRSSVSLKMQSGPHSYQLKWRRREPGPHGYFELVMGDTSYFLITGETEFNGAWVLSPGGMVRSIGLSNGTYGLVRLTSEEAESVLRQIKAKE
jgi:hypothetical protein